MPTTRSRIVGIDAARAVAIIGMVMVHFGPFAPDTSAVSGWLYRLSYGRASTLFVLLAGVGVSLLFASRTPTQAWTQVLWRAIVFLPVGAVLQDLDTGVAVILQFYAAYYLLAAAAAALPTAVLAPLTGAWAVLGSLLFVTLKGPDLVGRGTATTLTDPAQLLGDLAVDGFYPLITWAPALLLGVVIGRADLRDRGIATALLLGGSVVAATAYGLSEIARAVAPPSLASSPFLLAEGHTGAPLNVIGTAAVATAVLAMFLLIGAAAPRVLWPLTATGQLALTIYVGHLIVLDLAPQWLEGRASVAQAWSRVGRFTLVVVVLSVLWRHLFAKGPLEWLLALPSRAASPARPPVGPAQEAPLWSPPTSTTPTPPLTPRPPDRGPPDPGPPRAGRTWPPD